MSVIFHTYLLNSMLVLSFCYSKVSSWFANCVLKCFQLVLRTFGPVYCAQSQSHLAEGRVADAGSESGQHWNSSSITLRKVFVKSVFTFLLQWEFNEMISLCRLIFVGLRGYVHIGNENIKCVGFSYPLSSMVV